MAAYSDAAARGCTMVLVLTVGKDPFPRHVPHVNVIAWETGTDTDIDKIKCAPAVSSPRSPYCSESNQCDDEPFYLRDRLSGGSVEFVGHAAAYSPRSATRPRPLVAGCGANVVPATRYSGTWPSESAPSASRTRRPDRSQCRRARGKTISGSIGHAEGGGPGREAFHSITSRSRHPRMTCPADGPPLSGAAQTLDQEGQQVGS
jgi:hypothetical protein